MSDFFEKPLPWGAAASDNIIREFRELINSNRVRYFDVEQFEQIVDYYLNSSEYNYAQLAINMAVEQHPNSSSILIRKAEVLFHNKNLYESLSLLKNLAELEPSNPDIFITLGAVYSRMGESEKAVISLRKTLKLVNHNEADHIYEALGHEFWSLDLLDKGLSCFKKSLRIQPDNPDLLERVYEIYSSEKDNEKGLLFFNKLVENKPYCAEAWYYISSLHYGIQEFSESKFAIELCLAVTDDYTEAYKLLANCLYELKEYQDAIVNYKVFLNRTRVTAQVLTKIGECYEMLGKEKYALFYFQKAIDLNPKFPDSYLGYGIICNLMGRHKEALININKAIDLNPKQNEYWHFLALCHGKSNEFESAILSFEKSIELDSKYKIAWLDFIDFLKESNELDSGMDTIERALMHFPKDEDLLIRKTAFFFELGNKNRALNTFENSLFKEQASYSKMLKYYPRIKEISEIKELLELYS